MKKIWMALPFFLWACGDHKSAPAKAEVQPEPVSLTLAATESFDEETVLQAAGRLVSAGGSLPSKDAERCWKAEGKRALVRDACLLAWSASEERSDLLGPLLRSLLLTGASKIQAVACVRKPGLVESLEMAELQRLLTALSAESPWIMALVVRKWLAGHSLLGPEETLSLWKWLNPEAKELGPGSLGAVYAVASMLGRSYSERVLSVYCPPGLFGLAQSRCWRFLSTLVDSHTGQGLDRSLLPFLPVRPDSGWVLFERSFPERALLLRKYF
ncbi:MAG TPA: hypothetical protein VIH99_00995 [Bdellovibrionota bacterium]|jgi:hypothetical protein